ncbi:MAG: class B sortase [Clostridia bacterium]|nr:class B sortase [Clostridia bacterium]
MKRLMALLAALLLPFCALAEEARGADWFAPVMTREGSLLPLLTQEQLTLMADLPSEEVHALVEALFTAAAGVTEREELALWKTLKTQSAREERNAENAAYRARTLPWLMQAFAPGNRMQDGEGSPAAEGTAFPDLADSMEALRNNPQGQAYLAMAASFGALDAEGCMAVTQAVVQRWLAEIDHEQLAGINSDYQFWLYAAGTPIDYPVVQCGNNSYYMDRMFNRKANKAGTLFVDYRNLPDFADPNTLIYGHHMRDSSMFHSLTDYESRGFFEAHPWMVVVRADEILLIEVFAGYVTDGRDHCYDIALSDEGDMGEFVAAAKEKSNFDAHVEIDCARDHLVTLSTCAYNFENARYVVIGRLVTMWEGK